ncbi:hypothetical protein CTA2_5883 [Colletotrichum tanaceti]|uniref:Uncharacterized protein n=1 Tax=Colletotrichum tanaceti TaxID=1306861 RepID=A0A4U6XGW4_9PEZI|nr:hypothetical protein CTA2_5883 [Colletotrichum tanaceti]TKW53257.1 hypothetical protein CTA1_6766 [Colletotrichum tanaceti]
MPYTRCFCAKCLCQIAKGSKGLQELEDNKLLSALDAHKQGVVGDLQSIGVPNEVN